MRYIPSSYHEIADLQQLAICSVGELFGGVERHILGMLQGLAAYQVTPTLIVFNDGELAAQARAQGIAPIVLAGSNLAILSTARRLARVLAATGVDVVHVHGYKAMVFCAAARWWYPFVIVKTEHGLPESTAGKSLTSLRERCYRLIDRITTRLSRATVCYVTEELLNQYGYMPSGEVVIPNGVSIDSTVERPRPPEFRPGGFTALIVGRLDTVKGVHVALEAFASGQLPDDCELCVIGTGSSEAQLKRLAASYGIEHRVRFLGFRRDVYSYIANCDVLLMPSLHEGLPYTLLEAMALRVPIVASRVGGLAEALEEGVTAALVPPCDAGALGRAIQRLYDDQALRHRLAVEAQRVQRQRYSLEAMTAAYLEVYQAATRTAQLSSLRQ